MRMIKQIDADIAELRQQIRVLQAEKAEAQAARKAKLAEGKEAKAWAALHTQAWKDNREFDKAAKAQAKIAKAEAKLAAAKAAQPLRHPNIQTPIELHCVG